MILDTHVHSKEFSYDSPLPIREAILRGKAAGLDGLCVTDHEHMGMRRLAEQLTRRHDFLVLVGMEFLTFEGDLLVFGTCSFSALTRYRIAQCTPMSLFPSSTGREGVP